MVMHVRRLLVPLSLSLTVLAAVLLSTFWMLGRPAPVAAAAFTVDSLADGSDTNLGDGICDAGGSCTLRAAVEQANASIGADTISFSVAGTIALSSQIAIKEALTINGPGAGVLTIDGGSTTRLFTVTGGPVTIARVTLKNGRPAQGGGGALYVDGSGGDFSVRVDAIVAEANSAGDGGAFYVRDAQLTVDSSTIRKNGAGRGGAFFGQRGGISTLYSVVEDNSATEDGGAFYLAGQAGNPYAYPYSYIAIQAFSILRYNSVLAAHPHARGGAIYAEAGEVAILDSTLHDNSALSNGVCHPVYNTPGGQGGALFANGSSLWASNSTFQANVADVGGAICSYPDLPEVGYGGALVLSATLATVENSTFDANEADWGGGIRYTGPSTMTVTAGTFSRNATHLGYGGAIYGSGSLVVAGTLFQENDADASFAVGGGGALSVAGRSAVISNSTFLSNTSRFGGAIDSGAEALQVADTLFRANRSFAINGCGGALYISYYGATVLRSEFRANQALDSAPGAGGGAICNEGTLHLSDSILHANSATRHGGAIRNHGQLALVNSSLTRNDAGTSTYEGFGGGLYNVPWTFGAGWATVLNSRFHDNVAADDGGGIASRSTITVAGTTLAGNQAGRHGGGAYLASVDGAPASAIYNSTFSQNSAARYTGGLHHAKGKLWLANSTFYENNSDYGDFAIGALANPFTGTMTTTNNIVYHNSAAGADCWGTFNDSGPNMASDASCGFSLTVADPGLAPLAANGGAETPAGVVETHGLRRTSPARHAADAAACAAAPLLGADQRGVARLGDALCDLGAYERVEVAACRAPNYPLDDGIPSPPDTLSLPGSDPVVDVDISLLIAHSFVGQLAAFVEHGSGNAQLLEFPVDGSASCALDDVDATFDDAAAAPANSQCSGNPAIDGIYTPVSPLADLNGESAAGNWDLYLYDAVSGETGVLQQWCVYADLLDCATVGSVDPQIDRNAGRVRLTWSPPAVAGQSEIFRARNDPYFTPSGPAYATATGGSWTDPDALSLGDPAANHYYLLLPTSACATAPPGQRVGAFTFRLAN